MSGHPASGTPPAPYRVRTVNVSINSANKIHDDTMAARYGFRGGLVAGTLIYSHMTTPLVERLGEAWLDASVSELKLARPAYDGEWLTVSTTGLADAPAGTGYCLSLCNEAGDELATLETRLTDPLPPPDARADLPPADDALPIVPITWDAVQVEQPLRALRWDLARVDHEAWCDSAGDRLAVYREGERPRIQPGRVLQGANEVFSNHFLLNPWIHAASRIVHRGPLRLGDPIEIRAVTIAKWERKGHEFVQLYIVFLNGGRPAVEVFHTAIYKVRPAQP